VESDWLERAVDPSPVTKVLREMTSLWRAIIAFYEPPLRSSITRPEQESSATLVLQVDSRGSRC
jgi:hypothetical protein